ncbi:YtxH domain-containing protein, partial [Staphylococcus sp. EG-SA-17]
NRDDQSVKNNTIDAKEPTGSRSELEREIESLKRNFFNIIDYGKQVKNDGVSYGSEIGDEFKTLIGDFKSDINPNIEKLQSHIENLQNRGEEISNTFSKDNK